MRKGASRRAYRAAAVALTVVGALWLGGCGSARRGEPIEGPLKLESKQVARGQQVFMTHCHKCHPGGESGLGPALNNKPLPGPMIKAQVRAGMGAMPSFPERLLGAEDLDALVLYLKTLRKH